MKISRGNLEAQEQAEDDQTKLIFCDEWLIIIYGRFGRVIFKDSVSFYYNDYDKIK